MIVERRMAKARLNLKGLIVSQGELELASKVSQVETMIPRVENMPIVADPDLMNKYREQIDELFNELAASDAEIDESLKLMDEIDGRIEQLSNAPGSVRAREVAAEEAENAIKEMKQLQLKRAGLLNAQAGGGLKNLGLYSEQELQELLSKQEEQQTEQIDVLNDNNEYNYN